MDKPNAGKNNEALSADDAALIAESLTPIDPPPARAEALKARVMAQIESPAEKKPGVSDWRTVRTDDREWVGFSPGVEICVLFENDERRSALLRMSPGSFLFPHYHELDEESIILEGEAVLEDGLHLRAGDYQFAPAGEVHPIINSPNGCIVLVHGERRPRTRVNVSLLSRLLGYFTNRPTR